MLKYCFLLLILALTPAWANDALYLELSGQGQKMSLGLAEFTSIKPDVQHLAKARQMRDVVKNDLLFVRVFNLLEGGAAPLQRKINFSSWLDLKADVLVTGTFNLTKQGDFEFVGGLYDVPSKQLIVEKKYVGEPGQERRIAHLWADEIIRRFLGQSGISHSKIYFVNDATGKKEVCVVDYDGENFKRLTQDRSIALLPKVSPDGQWLVFMSYRSGVPALYLMRSDGRERRVLTKYEGLNSAAAWMPDGKSVVATLSMGREPNLYLIDLTGKVLQALTQSNFIDTAPNLSPDGRQLAFTSDRPGYPQIYMMETTGANIRRFSHSGECDSPAWSPQGTLVAFSMSEAKGNFDIYTMDVGTGQSQRLTWATGDNENPSWSADGRFLVFTSTRRGPSELWVMGSDGSNAMPLGSIPGNSFTPHWGP